MYKPRVKLLKRGQVTLSSVGKAATKRLREESAEERRRGRRGRRGGSGSLGPCYGPAADWCPASPSLVTLPLVLHCGWQCGAEQSYLCGPAGALPHGPCEEPQRYLDLTSDPPPCAHLAAPVACAQLQIM